MAYLTFEFYPGIEFSSFEPIWEDPVLESQTESGHKETASDDVRGRWRFKFGLSLITPDFYIYLIDFFHAHRGGALFYFKIPYGMAGVPDEAMIAVPGGDNPWDSEVEPGAGEGPTYLVRRVQKQFGPKKKFLDKKIQEHYYETTEDIEFEQV